MPVNAPFLEAALRIGRRLCRDAIWSGDRCSWLGDAMEPVDGEWRVVHRAVAADLYGGTAGIALLLARLYRLSGEAPLRLAALGALRAADAARRQIAPAVRCSLYSGELGVALAMAAAARDLGEAAWLARASAVALDAGAPEPGAGLDIVAGSAGAVAALLELEFAVADGAGAALRALATAHGERLLAAARQRDGQASWDTLPGQTSADPTGFSHGAAGIAWSLLELGTRCDDARFRATAEAGFAYEQACFDAQQRNWPDFRVAPPGSTAAPGTGFAVAWCHGAAGIGLARLRAWQLSGRQAYGEQAVAALQTTAAFVGQTLAMRFDCSPCHGHVGNLELMLLAATALEQPAWLAHARSCGEALLGAWQDGEWPCGVPGGGETPALLTGLAGIAWGLLRLHDPVGTPSLLLPTGWFAAAHATGGAAR